MTPEQWRRKLDGLTQQQALVRIAEVNGGQLRVTEARDILLTVGLTRQSKATLSSAVYRMLGGNELFECIAPGTFRLTDAHQAELSQSTATAEAVVLVKELASDQERLYFVTRDRVYCVFCRASAYEPADIKHADRCIGVRAVALVGRLPE